MTQTPAADNLGLLRLYRRDDEGVLSFREAWHDEFDDVVVINHGTVGHISKDDASKVADLDEARTLMDAFLAQCHEDGYAEIPREEQFWVLAQFALKSKEGTARDQHLKTSAVDALVPYFAWRGLGVVDHTTLAEGKLNIMLLCPDPGKAVKALVSVTREEKLDPTKLSIGVAPFNETQSFKRRHPAGGGTLSL